MFEKDEDYKKARKESKDRITKVIKVWSAREETLHDEGFQKGAEYGYNKANEWHYVKAGDLPKDDNDVLVLLKDETMQVDYYFSKIGWNLSCKADVIAWKEIVPPKESE